MERRCRGEVHDAPPPGVDHPADERAGREEGPVEVDLDRSRVEAARLSAFGLLYISGLALLKHALVALSFEPAENPKAIFPLPLVWKSALTPLAVLAKPFSLLTSAYSPVAVL